MIQSNNNFALMHKYYTNINNQILAKGQRPLEGNPDIRLDKIWTQIMLNELEVSYEYFGSVDEINFARKSDDSDLWIRCQPRTNSISMEERMQDVKILNRAHDICCKFLTGEWEDYNNPPVVFEQNGKYWAILGNGRIAALKKAEEILTAQKGEKCDIPFHVIKLDLSKISDVERKRFVLSCAQQGNSTTGEEVEEETRDQIVTALSLFFKEISEIVSNTKDVSSSYYSWAVAIYNHCLSEGRSEKTIRSDISHSYLQNEKKIYDPSTRGRIISETFSDHNDKTGDRFDLDKDFKSHLSCLWNSCFSMDNCFETVEPGWTLFKGSDGVETYNVITSDTSARNISLPFFENSLDGNGRKANIIHNPYLKDPNSGNHKGNSRISVSTRQDQIVNILKKMHDWNTCHLKIKGNGIHVNSIIFPRMIDHTANDDSGNLDCDVVYYWAGSRFKRMDKGLFGREEKLKEIIDKEYFEKR